ncbi:hypothetical protein NMY22_g13616 [Coprinellus aureogranulatus]|nr:hypothetical protein NMY22_g13616 [Coprinellus aureogranulatus]
MGERELTHRAVTNVSLGARALATDQARGRVGGVFVGVVVLDSAKSLPTNTWGGTLDGVAVRNALQALIASATWCCNGGNDIDGDLRTLFCLHADAISMLEQAEVGEVTDQDQEEFAGYMANVGYHRIFNDDDSVGYHSRSAKGGFRVIDDEDRDETLATGYHTRVRASYDTLSGSSPQEFGRPRTPCPPELEKELSRSNESTGCGEMVYDYKYNPDGSILWGFEKARLVAQGFSQRPDSYDETYAPVARLSTIRTVLALTAHLGFFLFAFDIKTAFLHSMLKSLVYCRQIPGFPEADVSTVLLLQVALYGLKQAAFAWYCHFYKVLAKVKNLAVAKMFLSWRIYRDLPTRRLWISQAPFIQTLIDDWKIEASPGIHVPVEALPIDMPDGKWGALVDPNISKDDAARAFQSINGSIGYAAMSTRSEMAHTHSTLGQYNADPQPKHLASAKHALRYLAATKNYVLLYDPNKELHPLSRNSSGLLWDSPTRIGPQMRQLGSVSRDMCSFTRAVQPLGHPNVKG